MASPKRPAPGPIGPLPTAVLGLARLVMVLGLRGSDREFLRGDLDEELQGRLRRSSRPVAASGWYLRQAVRSVAGRSGPRALHRAAIHGRWQADRRGDGFMRTLGQDIRYSLRVLLKQPGFALAVITTLTLGLGATSAIFAFVNGLLLRPMPYANADRLVMLESVSRQGNLLSVNYLDYLDWRERSESFASMAIHLSVSFNLATDREPVRVSGQMASADLLEVLGVEPEIGRGFLPEDDRPGAERVALISRSLWERYYEADPGLVGSEITLHGRPYTLIGIMPAGFHYLEYAEIWVPVRADPADQVRGNHFWNVVARLREGASVGAAKAEMRAIGEQIALENPEENSGQSATATPFRESRVGDSGFAMLVFQGVVIFVLLIATVNVGNLLLARAFARRKEIAVRSAIGASRGRLVRQLLTESLVLATFGGALGLMLGRWGRDAILGAVPIEIPPWMDFSIDLRVVLFLTLMTVLVGIVFGLVPALYASRDLNETLKHGGDGVGGRSRRRLRSVLVVAEVALALILLVGAGLMMRSLARVSHVDPGLDDEGVLTMRLSLPAAQYEVSERKAFFERAQQRLATLPGVIATGTIGWLPLSGSSSTRTVLAEGFETPGGERPPSAVYNLVGGDYFEVMRIPLLRGRLFAPGDGEPESRPVAMVSASFAEERWPGQEPIGKRIAFGITTADAQWLEVIGVVGDVRHFGLDTRIWTGVFVPHRQSTQNTLYLTLKTGADPLSLVPSARSVIRELDPKLPIYRIRSMEQVVRESMWEPRLYSWMFGVFASIALGLATVGLYGVMTFAVGQRTHEIGIRMALGAGGSDVLRLVVRQAMLLVGIGVAIGLVGAILVSGVMSSLISGVSSRDPLVYAVVTGALAAVALFATLVPGRRATRVDPMVALRTE